MAKVPQGLVEIANRLKVIELSMKMSENGASATMTKDFDFVSSLRIGNGML